MASVSLAASVPVKNELGRYLQPCIASLREFCDIICVLDDGSTDRTGEWLDDNQDDQLLVKHIDSEAGFFAGHEGRKRQALLGFTLEQGSDWVLAVDADEFVANWQQVRHFIHQPRPLGSLVMEEVWKADDKLHIRQDGGWRQHAVPILWNTKASPVWTIQDRALACGREPEQIRGMRARPTGADVLHFGWADEQNRQVRYQRYVEADNGKFHNRRHLDSILWADDKVQLSTRPWPPGLKERLA